MINQLRITMQKYERCLIVTYIQNYNTFVNHQVMYIYTTYKQQKESEEVAAARANITSVKSINTAFFQDDKIDGAKYKVIADRNDVSVIL